MLPLFLLDELLIISAWISFDQSQWFLFNALLYDQPPQMTPGFARVPVAQIGLWL